MGAIRYLGQVVSARPGETILQAMLREGVLLRHSCGRGSCHTCVLRLQSGSLERLRPADAVIEREGHFLPCVCRPEGDIEVEPPTFEDLGVDAELVGRRELARGLLELDIAPMRTLAFRPGQHLRLHRPDGVGRPYSIASLPEEDYFFRLHCRVHPHGTLSRWLASAPIGQTLNLRGPYGTMHYRPEMVDQDLLLIATGSGIGTMLAIARDAQAQGHRGQLRVCLGVREAQEIWFATLLDQLRDTHPRFEAEVAVSRPDGPVSDGRSRVTDRIRAHGDRLRDHRWFACGRPDMVADVRVLAVEAGVARDAIHVDPFETEGLHEPADYRLVDATRPDEALWEAIGRGPGLRRILSRFYTHVYADPRLAPFFQGMEIDQVVGKQYTFLADLFSGRRDFMGLMPYNAHHWMVISDNLFDHREALFESVLRAEGLAEPLIRRWLVLHERFRVSIVKDRPSGLWMDGAFQAVREQTVEVLGVDSVCDGCGSEIRAGEPARYLHRIGHLHCAQCAALDH